MIYLFILPQVAKRKKKEKENAQVDVLENKLEEVVSTIKAMAEHYKHL